MQAKYFCIHAAQNQMCAKEKGMTKPAMPVTLLTPQLLSLYGYERNPQNGGNPRQRREREILTATHPAGNGSGGCATPAGKFLLAHAQLLQAVVDNIGNTELPVRLRLDFLRGLVQNLVEQNCPLHVLLHATEHSQQALILAYGKKGISCLN